MTNKRAPSRRLVQQKQNFLIKAGWSDSRAVFLAGDASPRHYERLSLPDEFTTAVLMDASQDKLSVPPFLEIGSFLGANGFSVPEVLCADPKKGLALIEDFGDMTYRQALAVGASEEELYQLATDVLIALHRISNPPQGWKLLNLDAFETELTVFLDWYCPAFLEMPLTEADKASFFEAWRATYAVVADLPTAVVLRDYHMDNLMLLEGRSGVARCGILDFQDAAIGPIAYDLVSLLEDARRDIPEALQASMIQRYVTAFPDLDLDAFGFAYTWLGAQRSTKILGVFARLFYRDGKKQYMEHEERLWRLVGKNLSAPYMAPVRDWFSQRFSSKLQKIVG